MKVELDLFNYATKANLKNATGVDTSRGWFSLASLKLQTDKLDIGKLETTSVGFKKLSYVVDKEVI